MGGKINMALISCPECSKEISDKAQSCPHCGHPINNTNSKYRIIIVGYHDTDTSACAGLTETFNIHLEYNELMDILNNCPYTIVECDTVEEANLYARKLQRWGIDIEIINPNGQHEYIDTNIVSCPKCGSTNIQIVPRKWSLLTGIFTNATDRVCVNCKYKW